jgi:hypothetical protein
VFLESLEVHGAFRENPVDERTRAAQQRRARSSLVGGRTGRRRVDGGLYFPNLRTLFVKLARGQLGEAAVPFAISVS